MGFPASEAKSKSFFFLNLGVSNESPEPPLIRPGFQFTVKVPNKGSISATFPVFQYFHNSRFYTD